MPDQVIHQDPPPNPPLNPDPIPSGPTNSKVVELQDQVIRENAAEIARLRAELEVRRHPPKEPDPPPSSDDFFKDPYTYTSRAVDERIKASVGPLIEDLAKTRRMDAYIAMKNVVRNDEKGKDVLPLIEQELDKLSFEELKQGREINANWMHATILALYGNWAMNNRDKLAAPPTTRQVIPPNIPSNTGRPADPTRDPADQEVEAGNKLNESEKRLARERYGSATPYTRYLTMRDGGTNDSGRGTGSMTINESERRRS